MGYMLKLSPPEELISAIRNAAEGRSYITTLLSRDLISTLLNAGTQKSNGVLTPRQREVLQLISEGKTMKEVATALNISPRTAESHKYEIMQVLGAKTTADLIQYALRTRMIEG
jgi:DNA-binding NarL/FixJ family response regulator